MKISRMVIFVFIWCFLNFLGISYVSFRASFFTIYRFVDNILLINIMDHLYKSQSANVEKYKNICFLTKKREKRWTVEFTKKINGTKSWGKMIRKLILKEFRFACASIKICRKLKRITTLAKIQPPRGPGCENNSFQQLSRSTRCEEKRWVLSSTHYSCYWELFQVKKLIKSLLSWKRLN